MAVSKETQGIVDDVGVGLKWQLENLKKIVEDKEDKKTMPKISAIVEIAKMSGSYEKEQVGGFTPIGDGKGRGTFPAVPDFGKAISEADQSLDHLGDTKVEDKVQATP